MANLLDSIVKGYTTGMNNQLNAQKAYIDAYITGINARNAVNQEARTKDQYWNYTQPFQASNLGITLGQNNIQQRILNDPNYQNDLFGVATSKASQANQLATADLNNMGYYIDTQGNLAKTGALTSGYNAKEAKFNLSQQDAVNKQKADAIAHSGVMQPIQNQTALVQAQQYYENLTNPTGTATDGTTNTDVPTTIMLQNGYPNIFGTNSGGRPSTNKYWTNRFSNSTGTTPASGLPSNPSNAQKNSQSQTASGYTNKYYEDTDAILTKLDAEIDKQKRLSDLAQQYGKTSDYIDAQYNLNVAKKARSDLTGNSIYNRANRFALNPFDALFNNKSKADHDYEQAIRNSNNR